MPSEFLLNPSQNSLGKPVRDPRVDILRGLALLMIFINHIPANPLATITMASWGVADAADLFVMLAGFSAAMAYGPVMDWNGFWSGCSPVARRIAVLYAVQALLFLIVCGMMISAMSLFSNPLYAEAINIWPVLHDPWRAIREAAFLCYQPFYLDILPLYIVLLIGFPLIYAVAKRSPALALISSFGLWSATQVFGFNFPTAPEYGQWFFNPFAWQLIFSLGVVGSIWVRQNGLWTPSWFVVVIAAIIVIGGFVLRSPWSEVWQITTIPALPEAWIVVGDKSSLALSRVIYAVAFSIVLWRVLPRETLVVECGLWRHVARMGRHSLPVFAFGTLLSITAHIVIVEAGSEWINYYTVSMVGILLMTGLGSGLAWRKTNSEAVAAKHHVIAGAVVAT
jgi:hypothetical protein